MKNFILFCAFALGITAVQAAGVGGSPGATGGLSAPAGTGLSGTPATGFGTNTGIGTNNTATLNNGLNTAPPTISNNLGTLPTLDSTGTVSNPAGSALSTTNPLQLTTPPGTTPPAAPTGGNQAAGTAANPVQPETPSAP